MTEQEQQALCRRIMEGSSQPGWFSNQLKIVYDHLDSRSAALIPGTPAGGDDFCREHLDYVIAAVKALYEDRESIPNMRIVWGHNLPMRHFHAFLEPYPNEEK